MKHVMRYLQYTKNIGIEYTGATPFNFHGCSDSDWAEDRERRRSTSGNVFLMAGGAVCWANKRQATVAASSTQAKYMAAAFAANGCVRSCASKRSIISTPTSEMSSQRQSCTETTPDQMTRLETLNTINEQNKLKSSIISPASDSSRTKYLWSTCRQMI